MADPNRKSYKTPKDEYDSIALDHETLGAPLSGFVVTKEVEIGRVEIGGSGELSPREAAYLLIAQDQNGGTGEAGNYTYRMPGPDIGMVEEIVVSFKSS